MEMVNRYIYAVTKRLPKSQQEEITRELKGLIVDMLEERGHGEKPSDQAIEEVLLELGNPKKLADRYRDTKTFLIGPELYHPYVTVLKIVMVALFISMTVSAAIEVMMEQKSLISHFGSYLASLITITIQGVGWVTIVFAVMQYFNVGKTKDFLHDGEWKPANLEPVPSPKNQIKRSDSIVNIIFSVFFVVVFLFLTPYIGAYFVRDGQTTIVSVFNEGVIQKYLPLIILLLGISIIKSSMKLIIGKWTFKLVVFLFVCDLVTLVVLFILLSPLSLLNPHFLSDLTAANVITKGSDVYEIIHQLWNQSTFWIMLIAIVTTIIDALSGLYKLRK